MNIELSTKAAHVFKTHPKVDELHATSDEMLFFKQTDAEAHAADLKDKKVTPILRNDAVKAVEIELMNALEEMGTADYVPSIPEEAVVETVEETTAPEEVVEEAKEVAKPAPKKK